MGMSECVRVLPPKPALYSAPSPILRVDGICSPPELMARKVNRGHELTFILVRLCLGTVLSFSGHRIWLEKLCLQKAFYFLIPFVFTPPISFRGLQVQELILKNGRDSSKGFVLFLSYLVSFKNVNDQNRLAFHRWRA